MPTWLTALLALVASMMFVIACMYGGHRIARRTSFSFTPVQVSLILLTSTVFFVASFIVDNAAWAIVLMMVSGSVSAFYIGIEPYGGGLWQSIRAWRERRRDARDNS